MTNPVAKISYEIADILKPKYTDLDIQIDANCVPIIDQDEAKLVLTTSEYSIVEFEAAYIGAPRPKKRK